MLEDVGECCKLLEDVEGCWKMLEDVEGFWKMLGALFVIVVLCWLLK